MATGCTLLELPLELRDMIRTHLYQDPQENMVRTEEQHSAGRDFAVRFPLLRLRLICKKLRVEYDSQPSRPPRAPLKVWMSTRIPTNIRLPSYIRNAKVLVYDGPFERLRADFRRTDAMTWYEECLRCIATQRRILTEHLALFNNLQRVELVVRMPNDVTTYRWTEIMRVLLTVDDTFSTWQKMAQTIEFRSDTLDGEEDFSFGRFTPDRGTIASGRTIHLP